MQATLSIVSHGHGELVAQLLRDLSQQTAASRLEVVLTLNAPEADPDPGLYGALRVKILRNTQPQGFGANHNAALRNSEAEWVLIVNPDIRLPDVSAIESLMVRHDAALVGIVAPRIRNSRGQLEDSVRANLDPVSLFRRRLLGGKGDSAIGEDDWRFGWAAGMFLALPLASWRSVGGFDERFFLYCEDYDLCARVALGGRPVVIDEGITVVHDARRTSHRSLRFLRWHVTSLLKVWTSTTFWKITATNMSRDKGRTVAIRWQRGG